jgi:hypothetical protein
MVTVETETVEDLQPNGGVGKTVEQHSPERDGKREAMESKIAKEIKQTSGFDSLAELRDAMPDNPDAVADAPQPEKRGRKAGKQASPSRRKSPAPVSASDPFANDVRYQQACGRMAAFGGKGMIVRGFDAGARILEDETFKLDDTENLAWDDFFYVLSKKPAFDVGKPIFLVLFFFITLFAQLGWRVLERTESEFIHSLFAMKPKDENTQA